MALLVFGAHAVAQTLPEPRTIKINDRVYVLLGPIQHANRLNQGYMINSAVIVGDKSGALGVIGVAIWYALAILYFAAYGRKTLVLSPEEEFAVKHREGAAPV